MSEPTDIEIDEEEFAENTLIEPAGGQGHLQQTDPGGLRA
jgi:hypothetical protein